MANTCRTVERSRRKSCGKSGTKELDKFEESSLAERGVRTWLMREVANLGSVLPPSWERGYFARCDSMINRPLKLLYRRLKDIVYERLPACLCGLSSLIRSLRLSVEKRLGGDEVRPYSQRLSSDSVENDDKGWWRILGYRSTGCNIYKRCPKLNRNLLPRFTIYFSTLNFLLVRIYSRGISYTQWTNDVGVVTFLESGKYYQTGETSLHLPALKESGTSNSPGHLENLLRSKLARDVSNLSRKSSTVSVVIVSFSYAEMKTKSLPRLNTLNAWVFLV